MQIDKPKNIHIEYNMSPAMYHYRVASLAVKYISHGKIIDVGCGTGITLSIIHALNPEIILYGADCDNYCLQLTQNTIKVAEAYKLHEDPFDLSCLPEEEFDICILSHVLEHTLYPLGIIDQCLKLLKPNGYLILATPNPVSPKVMIYSLLRRQYVNKGHVHAWDRAHWINFLENIARVHVVEYAVDNMQLFPASWTHDSSFFKKIDQLLTSLFPWWSYSNISVVKKDEYSSPHYQDRKNFNLR